MIDASGGESMSSMRGGDRPKCIDCRREPWSGSLKENCCEWGLLRKSPPRRLPESDTEDIRRWAFLSGVKLEGDDRERGVNDARLDANGVEVARPISGAARTVDCLLDSVCRRMRPRLE